MTGDPEDRPPLAAAQNGVRSRRELLSAGGVAGAAALLAGCTSKVHPPSNIHLPKNAPSTKRDIQILNGLIALEYRAIAAYTAVIPLLPQPAPPSPKGSSQPAPPASHAPATKSAPPPDLKLTVPLASAAAQHFLSHELAHVTELSGFIEQVGDHPVKPAASYDLGHPKTKREVLVLLESIEQAQLTAYFKATTSLAPGKLRAAAAAIYANHAQHIMVWRFELGLPPIPSAFVTPAAESEGVSA